jgi:hypothetical protein
MSELSKSPIHFNADGKERSKDLKKWFDYDISVGYLIKEYLQSPGDTLVENNEEYRNFIKIIAENPTLNNIMKPLKFIFQNNSENSSIINKIIPIISNLFKTQVFDMGVSKNYSPEVLTKLALKYYPNSRDNQETGTEINDFSKYIVYTQNRTGFIVETAQDLSKLNNDEAIGFSFLDVKNVKGADLYGKSVGVERSNGDIAIQLGNYAVQQAIVDFEKTIHIDPEFSPYAGKIRLSFARYGGDEIVIKAICPNEILDKVLNKISLMSQEYAQQFEITVKDAQGKDVKTRLTIKDAEISKIPSLDEINERDLFIKMLSSYGLLLSPEELKITLQNPKNLKLLYDQINHREAIKDSHLNLIQTQNDAKFLKEYSKMWFCNPVFKYYFGSLTIFEKKVNENLQKVGINKFQKNTELRVNVRDSEFGLTRAILESFIRYSYEPTFSEVIATPALIESLLVKDKISALVVISNQIKGMNALSVVEGDNAINLSVKDSFIQVLYPELNLQNLADKEKYNQLISLTPREILSTKFNAEEVSTIGFGKRGPDAYLFATKDAPSSVLKFIDNLSKIKSYRSPHPNKNHNSMINIETGIVKTTSHSSDSFRNVNDQSKERWAQNVAERIFNMGESDFQKLINVIQQYPETASAETRKNYLVNQYNIVPDLANMATSFQSWSNRRLINLDLVIGYLKQYLSFSNAKISISKLNNMIAQLSKIANSYKES